nr:PREDICTED: uncharacterized protein LOC102353898 [Latimeria chalumnae]|eukprot:XP_014344323.1 PREDICTED: uncharacterized protein LOC102353898 [Latimeria chalumnae]
MVYKQYGNPSDHETAQNVALKGTATQSSKRDQLGVPERAIDGNKNSDFGYLSCTHTEHEMCPWWRVDLQQPYRISVVVITNRGDCCWECLRGAEIYIGNSLEMNGFHNPRCASITKVAKGSTDAFCCKGMIGRYITITIPMHKYLTLCEVEVYGLPLRSSCLRNPYDPTSKLAMVVQDAMQAAGRQAGQARSSFLRRRGQQRDKVEGHVPPRNVALMGTATQSSKRDQLGVPEHAIDGNKNSDFGYLSCTHTEHGMGPWWRIDLQQPYRISAVVITNRGDCCWERLRGAEIYIGNSLEENGLHNPRCASIFTVERGSTDSFCCNGMVGHYVTIAIPTRVEYLTLCEVEVYGVPVFLQINVALKGKATQSSKRDQLGVPEHAIDGSKNSDFGYLSCTHTEHEMGPWWRVDLQQPYRISAVVITNRGDCCWDHLRGAEIFIGGEWYT